MPTTMVRPIPEMQVREIAQALLKLPPEQIAQVHDFVLFLQTRYSQAQPEDRDDAWGEEDIRDLVAATLSYAEHVLGDTAVQRCLQVALALG